MGFGDFVKLVVLGALLLLAMCLPRPSEAQTSCAPRDAVLARLEDRYGEVRQSLVLGPSALFEVFANTATGTWTILATRPDGVTCLMASGGSFERVVEVLEEGDPL